MTRAKNNINRSIQYFWGAFALQLLVYGLLINVIIKHWPDGQTVMMGIVGILFFIPFTAVLMKKFKMLATVKPNYVEGKNSLFKYVLTQHTLLQSFYTFKRRYELVLIPVSTAIGVFLTFKLWVPGGVAANPIGAAITFSISIASCAAAIYSENKRNFQRPLDGLAQLLKEFDNEDATHIK